MTIFRAKPAPADKFNLGEGPVWDAARERILWVDITKGEVFEVLFDGMCTDANLTEEQLKSSPNSGRIFIAQVNATGAPTLPWSGSWSAQALIA